MNKVAVLCFDAGVTAHHQELLFLSRLLEIRNRLTILGCDRSLRRCTSINSLGKVLTDAEVDELKPRMCNACLRAQKEIAPSERGFLAIDLRLDALTAEQESRLTALKQSVLTAADVVHLCERGLQIGKALLFDFLIVNKIGLHDALDEKMRGVLISHVRDAFLISNFLHRISSDHPFDLAFYINGNNSPNSAFAASLRRRGTRCWSVEFSMGLSDLFTRIFFEPDRLPIVQVWSSVSFFKENGYLGSPRALATAVRALEARVSGRDYNSYSSASRSDSWAAFDDFKARHPNLVSVFLSSNDELKSHTVSFDFESDRSFFDDQIQWLSFIIDHAESSVGYVIRVHPRLSPNKRDQVLAPELSRLQPTLDRARSKANFLVIAPDDPISSYYIVLNSSLTLHAWSTMALESAALGVPAVVSFPGNVMFPISDLSPQPGSIEKFSLLFRNPHLAEAPRDENVIRWLSAFYHDGHLLTPAVRYADSKWRKILLLIGARLLRWRFTSRILTFPFRNLISISDDKRLYIQTAPHPGTQANQKDCMTQLGAFRRRARRFFGIKTEA